MYKIFTCLLAMACFSISFAQTTVTIPASADNTIYQENNNSNGVGENLFSGNNNGASSRRALLRFNLAAIPTSATITSVTLQLECNKTASGAQNVAVHKVSASWGEGTSDAGANEGSGAAATANDATWNHRFFNTTAWGVPGGDYSAGASATTSVNSLGTYTWSSAQLTADVQGWVTTPATNFGWIVIGAETGSQTAKRFGSRENPVGTDRPQLSVTYTTALPVTFLSFIGKKTNQGVQLKWETGIEETNDNFKVEHSADGTSFSTIAELIPKRGSGKNAYQFLHTAPLSGNNYYRIGQPETGGRMKYTPVITIQFLPEGRMTIYPNPSTDHLLISGLAINPRDRYEIFTAAGRRVRSGELMSNRVLTGSLAPAVYFLKVYSNNEVFSARFIKQR